MRAFSTSRTGRTGRTARIVGLASAGCLLFAAGCDGILGLDATTLAPDASSGDDAIPPGDDSGSGEGSVQDATVDSTSDVGVGEAGGLDGGTLDAGDAAMPVFTMTPSPLGVHQGSMLAVTITIARNGVLPGTFAVAFTSLPTGVTSTQASIGADAGTVQVTLTVASTVPVGSYTIDLTAHGMSYPVTLTVYGASGTVDSTFQGGYVLDPGAGAGSIFNAIAVDSTGRIVVGGGKSAGGWVLRRFTSDGLPDTTFDTTAAASLPATGTLSGLAIDDATQDIVCVGTSSGQFTVVVAATGGSPARAPSTGGARSLSPPSRRRARRPTASSSMRRAPSASTV